MKHSTRLSICILFLILCCSRPLVAAEQTQRQRLNVIVILADDLGWTDLGCFGSDFYETPHLDRLASTGMKFTQNYSACTVCSPTRSALLTGKYPARLHLTDWIPGRMPDNPKLLVPDWSKQLPLEEVTFAEVFKSAGYTTGSIGKWHLGDDDYFPEKQGFDLNVAGLNAGSPPSYIAPWKIRTLKEGSAGEHLTDRLGEEAVKFIESGQGKPFLLYLPHFAVHLPLQGRPDLVAKYRAKSKDGRMQTNVVYAAMIENLDAAVGRVLTKLDELKLSDHTIVVFTSDNGGHLPTTSNKPLRLGKASAYEGGVRVPMIVRWPGVIQPGSVTSVPVITMDIFPTLVEICGLQGHATELAANSKSKTGPSARDGVSLVPLLRHAGTLQRKELFWHYPHHQHYQLGGTMPYAAIRSGDFKLIEFFNDMHIEFYNIREDLSEERDLSAELPQLATELRNRLHAWRDEVDAQMPLPNPQYNMNKPEYTRPPRKARG